MTRQFQQDATRVAKNEKAISTTIDVVRKNQKYDRWFLSDDFGN